MTLLLNTLYITTPETHLYKENETVVVKINREKRLQVPIHHLQAIVILGTAYVSPDLSRMCLERHVAITFLSERGRFLGRMEGPDASGAWLRRNQMEAHLDETRSLAIAKTLVKGKLANQRHVVQRAAREANEEEARELTDISARIEMIQKQVDRMETHDQVRGCEGEAAARYFEGFPFMVRQQRGDFPWGGRNRRPPKDAMNALLSFSYALLMGDCLAACQSVGLDPALGFLHAFRPGRPALALDLMESFRPLVADRLALGLVNNQQVRSKGFLVSESGAVEMDEETRKEVITAHQTRKAQVIRHPFLNQEIPWGLVLQLEARLLARHLRGDLEAFPPFHPRG
ncbi:type I-C CRISPR-associated endonuclease Cas1c [Holophaga foetida]|uniref:type I-C CRISPR-associated endonuclease Cas1c n=1 Tax=Holophaga foetida TaxID=35839 RepID=UPI000247460B|nr:type I-C CRISPR-associated endonuclease Cas1c [Holophaga foetida]